ncbi:uncharacterized protein LOC133204673 [Saccostrea echinata]|uniref:uncharacterized protein LOC133204673 n=1 Tax=Saccostrea echinata TaxID=191078 RepID=UPI002A820DB2|nr:uncharacterized protein LOC133204673 [Saccostrea echinata]
MAEKEIENLISSAKRKRGANWSSEEEIVLIEEVLKFEEQLFGKLKGAGVKGKHTKIKEETWQSITDTLNLQFRNERTSDSISKKYDNIKQRAKDKIDGICRPKTGGGPPPAPMTQAEEVLYQAMDTRPNIVGLIGGIDSDEPFTFSNQQEGICQSSASTAVTGVVCDEGGAGGDASSSSNERRSTEKRKKKRAHRDILEELEIENLKLENEKLMQETKKLGTEQKKLETEEKKLQIEIEFLEMKKSYLICKLNSEFPECLLNPACI